MPQPVEAQRARAPAQLKARARAERERPTEASADQPFGRSLRCRAEPSAGDGVGGTSSTRVGRRRPSHAKLLLACGSKRSLRHLHGLRRVVHDARRTRSPAAPASTCDGGAVEPRRASSGGGEVAEPQPRGSTRGTAAMLERPVTSHEIAAHQAHLYNLLCIINAPYNPPYRGRLCADRIQSKSAGESAQHDDLIMSHMRRELLGGGAESSL